MKVRTVVGVAILSAVAIGGGVIGVGCSSSSGPSSGVPPTGSTSPTSTSTSVTVTEDAGPAVGAACAKDSDCPTAEKCSNDIYSGGNPIYPTAVCIAACTPPSDPSQGLGACGSASVPGAGICQPPGTAEGSGLCLPLCVVTPSGQITGCLANDVCEILGSIPDSTTASQTDGAGWCLPGCTQDSQCPAGSTCDPLEGACVQTPITAVLPIGATCDSSSTTTQCNCVSSAGSTQGYCTAVCVTGVSTCPGPPSDGGAPGADAGASSSTTPWVCTGQTNVVAVLDGGLVFTTQPNGLYGLCAPACRTDTDCARVGGHCSQGDPAAPSGYSGTCGAGPAR
jgi:hypothetical protein